MHTKTNLFHGLLDSEGGAAATEYALLISLIALTAIGGMTVFGGMVLSLFADAVAKFPF